MIRFESKVKLERFSETRWLLIEDLIFQIDEFAEVRVPAGVDTDGTSVPRVFRPFVSVWGNNSEAAVMHDYLYQKKSVPRIIADSLFMVALFTSGVNRFLVYVMFFAVRVFGRCAWRSRLTAV